MHFHSLPTHTHSLYYREGAIDRLIRLYKEVVPRTHGYLTHNGIVDLNRVQMMMTGKNILPKKIVVGQSILTGQSVKFYRADHFCMVCKIL